MTSWRLDWAYRPIEPQNKIESALFATEAQ